MARPKQFDRDEALRAGMRVFWQQGFAATTTEDLAQAMSIGRQSFYDTFGDKRRCYLEALRGYARDEMGAHIGVLRSISAPVEGLRDMLRSAADWTDDRRAMGCMIVGALSEFGSSDSEIASVLAPGRLMLEQAVAHLIREAKAKGEIAPSLDEQRAVDALLCTRTGIMLGAKAGLSPERLREVADFIIDRLTAR